MIKQDVQRALLYRLEDVCRHLFPSGKKEGHNWKVGSIDGEPGRSFDVNLKTGYWGDFSCSDRMSRNPVDLWIEARRIDFKTAIAEIHSWLGAPPEEAQAKPKSKSGPPSKELANHNRASRWWSSKLRIGAEDELEQIALDRHITAEACKLAQARSLLRFLDHREGTAWVITDRRRANALARLLGGKRWENGSKSKMLSGSVGKLPIGITEAINYENIAAVEGGPDLLAAFHFMLMCGTQDTVAPVCMPSTNAEFRPRDCELLRDKVIRLFPHGDAEGRAAALKWLSQLEPVCASIDVADLGGLLKADGSPAGDLNDLTNLDCDSWETIRYELGRLMVFEGSSARR
jgi:hypothetical protein